MLTIDRGNPLCSDIPEWLQEFRENWVDGELPEQRDCTTRFTRRFRPWALPGTGGAVPGGFQSNGGGDAVSDRRDECSIAVRRVRLARKSNQSRVPDSLQAGSRASNAKAMEKVASTDILFPRLGVGSDRRGSRVEPASVGNRRRFFSGWSVQLKGSVRWH